MENCIFPEEVVRQLAHRRSVVNVLRRTCKALRDVTAASPWEIHLMIGRGSRWMVPLYANTRKKLSRGVTIVADDGNIRAHHNGFDAIGKIYTYLAREYLLCGQNPLIPYKNNHPVLCVHASATRNKRTRNFHL